MRVSICRQGQPDLYPAGEDEAAKRLKSFTKRIDDYNIARDLPAVDGTSGLSAYLAAGVISPRQCLAAAKDRDDEGTQVWVSELTWRDFYTHVLVGFPKVSKHLPFKNKTKALDWRTSKKDFNAWASGQTGYPIVDAGMRQLNQTGLDAQSAPDGDGDVFNKEPADRLAVGGTLLYGAFDRWRLGGQQRRLAVVGFDGHGFGALLSDLQSF